jgi:arylsulfatase A-like enzyme
MAVSKMQVTRRQFVATGTTAAGALLTGRFSVAQGERPNILFLMTDQHRGDTLGAAGHPCVQTPNLDRIAREGVQFRCAYTSTPSCTPARAGLLTGLSPWNHGMLGYNRVALHYRHELPQMLRDAGYQTTGIGKMHYHPQRNLHGFHQTLLDESGRVESPDFVSDYRQWFRRVAPDLDPDATGIGWNDHRAKAYVLPEELHPTRWTGDTAVEWLEGYAREAPFFLKVSFARPHSPYDPPARFMDLYAGADIPPALVGDWAERNARRGEAYPNDLARGDLGPDAPLAARQGYYGNVTFIDEQIGRILRVLEQRGWMDNTLILMTADHGDMLGDHHLWRKTYGYEGSARIPMLIRWPKGMTRAKRGQVRAEPVELRDVLPTCLDAAGVAYDESEFDGRSMLNLARGRTRGWRETLDLEHSTCYWPENQWTGLTDGRHKYIYYAPTGQQELFDLQDDPGELHDLAGDPAHAGLAKEWRDRMIAHLAERGEPYVVNGDLGIREKPMVLGPNYPNDQSADTP